MQIEPLVSVKDLKVWFPVRKGLSAIFSKRMEFVKAVDGVSFDVTRGETLCIAGESGSGKTTLVRATLQLIKATAGSIFFEGRDTSSMDREELRKLRCKMQIIFQDPYESLDPRMSVFDLLAEPLEANRIVHTRKEKGEHIFKVLKDVGLVPPKDFARCFPHELSGGQRQRIGIARALILQPIFIVADEPVSMLDASVRTEILNLLLDLQDEHNLTYMYVTHDLAQARYIGNRILIMYLGKIMEKGPVENVVKDPIHPYTKALISNVPVPDPTFKRERIHVKGETPSSINVPSGCRFHPRCPYAKEICREMEPELEEVQRAHYSACHFFK